MTEDQDPLRQVHTVETADGRSVALTCPVCSSSTFYTSGPSEDAKRRGFRHVIIGMSGEDEMLYTTVKFLFCEACGYIMKFMLPKKEEEK